MLTNDNNAENKPKVVRRSSLKNRNQAPKLPLEALKAKPKRNSISWGQTDTFNFKENNPTLEDTKNLDNKEKEEKEEKHKKFLETRRKSVQNEFVPQKQLTDKNKELDEEILNEELKKNMENNIKIGKQAKDDISESRESCSSSGSGKEYSKSGSYCSSCNNKLSKSESPSKNESERDSLKISKKKNKKDEKKENNTKSKIKFKINDEKEIIKKNNKKKEKEKEKEKEDNKKINLKGKVKIIKKKEEYNEYKKEKSNKDKQEINEDNQEINTDNKEKEKENKPEIKDGRIRLISYKEAKELNLDKVAYIALTDGSILIVRKDLNSMNEVYANKSKDNLKNRNYISKLNFCIKGIKNEYENIFNNSQNMSQYNSIHQIYKRPSYNQNQSLNDFQRQHQPIQNNFPKSEYSFNGQLYTNNISLHNQNCSRNVQRNNKINTNNTTYFYNRYNPSTNSLFKLNRDPQLFKYFSPYKAQNPNTKYINHRHSLSNNNIVQSNNQPLKQYIQIKNTQRQPDRNKYKVIEVIPCNCCEVNNNQMLDNSQVNTKIIEPIIYQEVIPSETILSRNNSHYIHQRNPNIIYSPIETNYSDNNNCCMFEQELNDCLSNH